MDEPDNDPVEPQPQVLTVDAREAYEAIVKACQPFAGKIGGGSQILAALMEVFDETLGKAPENVQTIFWNVMDDKRKRALSLHDPIDPSLIN